MGWDAQRHRPLGNGYGRSPSKYRRGRILVAANVIQVLEPDTVTYVAGAQLGLPVASYAGKNVDVNDTVTIASTNLVLRLT